MSACWIVALLAAAGAYAEPARTDIIIETAAGQSHSFNVEVAATEEARRRGLMFRESLPENSGMLFQYDRVRIVAMWMKDTPLPLDMLFVRPDGVIANIAAQTTPGSMTPIYSEEPVNAVLELNAGTCDRLQIRAGDRVRHPFFAAGSAATSDSSPRLQSPSSTAVPPPGGVPHR
jgi:uncharacterized membrane protein (UPF0127 family)